MSCDKCILFVSFSYVWYFADEEKTWKKYHKRL